MADLKLLFDHLIRFEIELWNAVDARLRSDCDLQLTWFEVMRLLGSRGACRVQDIANEFGITTGGTSKVVDRIEGAGYCQRRANPDNRRSSLVELTPEGQRLLHHAAAVFDDELAQRVGAILPDHELEQLTSALVRLRAAQPIAAQPIAAQPA